MQTQVKISLILLSILFLTLMGCQGSNISNNGFLENGAKSIKADLVGYWEVVDGTNEELARYEFYNDQSNKVQLKVRGVETEMIDFSCDNDIQFSFHYLDENQMKTFVTAQFKSYDRQTLLCIESSEDEEGSKVIRLEKKVNAQ